MQEIIWARDLLGDWASVTPSDADLTPFHQIAATVDRTSLLPDAGMTAKTWDDWPQVERDLAEMWSIWCGFADKSDRNAVKRMREIARRHSQRPEPYTLLACVALLNQKRAPARKMLARALRLDSAYTPARSLLNRFESRGEPVLNFLERTHPVNVWLGKMRHRWRMRGT